MVGCAQLVSEARQTRGNDEGMMNESSGKILAAVLLLGVLAFGCTTSKYESDVPVSSGVPVSFRAVVGSAYSTFESDGAKIVEFYQDQVSYDNAIHAYSLQVSEAIDFNVSQVALVSMGDQSNGGYSFAEESVLDVGDYIEMNLRLVSPGANCVVTTAVIHPFRLLKIDSKKDVRIKERKVVNNC